jgi:hypothetical protein
VTPDYRDGFTSKTITGYLVYCGCDEAPLWFTPQGKAYARRWIKRLRKTLCMDRTEPPRMVRVVRRR